MLKSLWLTMDFLYKFMHLLPEIHTFELGPNKECNSENFIEVSMKA